MVPGMVTADEALGLDVLNAGYTDLDGGFNYFESVARSATFRCVSANLVGLDDGRPVLPPYVVVTPRVGPTRAGGPKVAVIGLTEALLYKVLDGPGNTRTHFLDPVRTDDDIFARARKEGDLLVVLGNLGDGTARLIAGRHPEIDVIIAADERQGDPLQTEFNGVPIFHTGILGKKLTRLELRRQKGPRRWGITPEIVPLNPQLLDDPDGARLVKSLRDEVTDRNRRVVDMTRPDDRSPSWVGPEACLSCHAAAVAAWRQSAHARAWEPVRKGGQEHVSLCLGCHATGYLRPNGSSTYRLPPMLANVGCEACHGAGSRHCRDPKNQLLTRGGEDACRTCHTRGQSPDFNYAEQWARIRH
jgi:hypothetical protein